MADIANIIRREDYDAIQSDLADLLAEYKRSGGASYKAAVESANRRAVALSPDEGVVPSVEPETHIDAAVDNRKIIDMFRRTPKERTPIRKRDVEDYKESAKQAVMEERRRAWEPGVVSESRGSYVSPSGSVDYKQYIETVDWGSSISGSSDALETVRSMVTRSMRDKFGGWGRIRTMAIVGGQLIFNGIMYAPVVDKQYLSAMPLDVADYMANGCMAMLFDYSCIKKMHLLTDFLCDDVSFYMTVIGDDLGMGARIGVSTMFRLCPNLQIMTLGTESVTRDELNKPSSSRIKERVRGERQHVALLNGMKHDICGGTQGIQDYFFKSVRDYATNRGDKGFLRFAGGVMARVGASAVAATVNLGTHLVAGVGKTIKEAFKAGFTPISSDEAFDSGK